MVPFTLVALATHLLSIQPVARAAPDRWCRGAPAGLAGRLPGEPGSER